MSCPHAEGEIDATFPVGVVFEKDLSRAEIFESIVRTLFARFWAAISCDCKTAFLYMQ